MTKEDLIPIRTTERAKELGRKGGLSKSPIKQFTSRLNGLQNKKGITEEQKIVIALLHDRDFLGAMTELLKYQMIETKDFDRRDKVLKRVQKALPQKYLAVVQNVNGADKIADSIIAEAFGAESKESVDSKEAKGDSEAESVDSEAKSEENAKSVESDVESVENEAKSEDK